MKRYVLDTSALLALRDDEAGADQVAKIFRLAQCRKALCVVCFMTPMDGLQPVPFLRGRYLFTRTRNLKP
jgi:hypothetical protein